MKLFATALLVVTTLATIAQNTGSVKQANELFQTRNFERALEEYLLLVQNDTKNLLYNYRIGVSYLNTNTNKTKAIPYLQQVVDVKVDDYPDALYLLAKANHLNSKYDMAIKLYTDFKAKNKGSITNLKQVDKDIEHCYNGKEFMKFPVNVTFENLGKNVNTPFADYFPFITKNEGLLYFNSRRDGDLSTDGRYYADVFTATTTKGVFGKAKPLPLTINSKEGNEEIVGLSPDGNQLVFMYDNNKSSGELLLGSYTNGNYTVPEALPTPNINSKANEIAASVTTNDDILYFASDRPGGYGGMDLYACKRLPNGQWADALNMGATINTAYDEDFPQITVDGKTLLFSSKGHTSMGGYDIFKSDIDDATHEWKAPSNVGFPLNTPDDDMNLCLEEGGKYGYITAVRKEGLGDQDIYRVTFNDVESKQTVLRGNCVSNEMLKKVEQVSITVTDVKSGEIYGTYLSNINSNKYIMILPAGAYEVSIEASGFTTINKTITILDKSDFVPEIEQDITLSPVKK
jgi:hypothetical protein